MSRIYLSHASADADFAGRLALALERAGLQIARERAPTERSPEDPQEAAERIEMTMRASDALVFVFSPAALASPWVRQELAVAQALQRGGSGVRLIAIVREPVRPPDFLAGVPTINALAQLPEDVARTIATLLATDATAAGEERARGITLPGTDQKTAAVGAAEQDGPAPELSSQAPAPRPQPPAPAPGAPPIRDEPPSAAPITGALAGAPTPRQAQSGKAAAAEALQFSAYHANTLPVATWNTLLVYAAVDAALAAVSADAATFTELGSAPRTSTGQSSRAVAQGAELTVEPHMAGVTFSPASDTFVWRGGWHRSLFRFQACAELADTEQPGWVDIYAGPMVPVARIDLAFAFTAPRPALATHRPAGRTVTSNPHDTVFISYSHRDREAFNQACDEYARFGIRVYTDEHLEAGADYERELGRMIASARVFHLLWSPTSASSAECRKEWTAALQREPSERFIKPWFWRQPLVAPPPEFSQHHISFRFQRLRRRLLKPATWF